MPNIAVYCGSGAGNHWRYMTSATIVGRTLASCGYGIVYGGASVGLMGAVATAALEAGGKVIGVIPRFEEWEEINHKGLTEIHYVDDMHQRKRMMSDLSCAALVLPGGLGTIDEFIEYATWSQLGCHQDRLVKHVGLLNVLGYYGYMVRHLDLAVKEGFISPEHRRFIQHYEFLIDFLKVIESE